MPRLLARRALVTLGLTFATLFALAPTAGAHTSLVSSEPATGSALDALERIVLRFDAPIDPAGVHIWLEDGAGVLPLGPVTHLDGDATTALVAVPPIGTGSYVISWHAIAADGDAAVGTIDVAIGTESVGAPAIAEPPPEIAADVPEPIRRDARGGFVLAALVAVSAVLTARLARAGQWVATGPSWLPAGVAGGVVLCIAAALFGGLASTRAVGGWVVGLIAVFAQPQVAHAIRGRRKEQLAR